MIILSWDIGIIHLAYCLLTYTDKWEILDWGNIDLSDNSKRMCKCGAKPRLFYKPNEIVYLCKRCSKKLEIKEPVFEEYFKSNNESTCQWVNQKSNKLCGKKTKYENGKCYCNSHAKTIFKKYCSNFKLQEYKPVNASKMSIDIIRPKIVNELDKRKHLLKADLVVVENQPTLKNPKMKAVSSTIYDYFLIRGVIDHEINQSNIKFVKYMSPSNKIKLADDNSLVKIKKETNSSKVYKLTKSLAVKYANQMTQHLEEWNLFFNNQKKKDDLADCFLQGVYYYTKNIMKKID